VLDAVQDPGNLGTILRTCAAFGVGATVALPGTVDLWNPKVVRGGMGAHFRHPSFHATADELFAFLTQHAVELWGADVTGTPFKRAEVPDKVAIAVGNEGAGLSAAVRERLNRSVSIPISSAVDSLNVAVATGILLYEMRA
jgi:TrmH family RNA methyltransferase